MRLYATAAAIVNPVRFRPEGFDRQVSEQPESIFEAGSSAVVGTNPLDRLLCVPDFRRVDPFQRGDYVSERRHLQPSQQRQKVTGSFVVFMSSVTAFCLENDRSFHVQN